MPTKVGIHVFSRSVRRDPASMPHCSPNHEGEARKARLSERTIETLRRNLGTNQIGGGCCSPPRSFGHQFDPLDIPFAVAHFHYCASQQFSTRSQAEHAVWRRNDPKTRRLGTREGT
jgi:hypothetical protein